MPGLPPYTVRVSDRARRITLSVTARLGLVVVVPRSWRGNPDEIVSAKAEWARAALARVAEDREKHVAGASALLPDLVDLQATGDRYPVRSVDGARGAARVSGGDLLLGGAHDEDRLAALRRWLDRTARGYLPERLDCLAAEQGLSYSRCRTTRARTRWGSCSAKGTISLNRNLMFLPAELVDALMMHELAHLRVMDHSARFWAELERLDPDARLHRVRLRDASRYVPAWADC